MSSVSSIDWPSRVARWKRGHKTLRALVAELLVCITEGEPLPRGPYLKFRRTLDRHSYCEERSIFVLLPPEEKTALCAEHEALSLPESFSSDADRAIIQNVLQRLQIHIDEEELSVNAALTAQRVVEPREKGDSEIPLLDDVLAAASSSFHDIMQGASLQRLAVSVMSEPDLSVKVARTFAIARAYFDGELDIGDEFRFDSDDAYAAGDSIECVPIPDAPARPSSVTEIDPRKVKGGSLKAILHGVAHAESYAIDLSWDIIARFGWSPELWGSSMTGISCDGRGEWQSETAAYENRGCAMRCSSGCGERCEGACSSSSDGSGSDGSGALSLHPRRRLRLPVAFFDDWVRVAAEEAMHFSRWRDRLAQLGCPYGSLPAHGMLWASCAETANNLLARLTIVHCVLEARGLDTAVQLRERLTTADDALSLRILQLNHEDEITHVRAGVRWLTWLTKGEKQDDASTTISPTVRAFHALVRAHFRGALRPPFNEVSRARAGMTPDWWVPLAAEGRGKLEGSSTAAAGGVGAAAEAEAEE